MPSTQKKPVDDGFFETAPHTVTIKTVIEAPIEFVFTAFADEAETWNEWFPGFNPGGRYTTPPPLGVGSERVMLMGKRTMTEKVIAYEPGKRWAFCILDGSLPVKAFAENYVFTDLGGRTELAWTVAYEGSPVVKFGLRLAGPRMLGKAARQLSSRYPG